MSKFNWKVILQIALFTILGIAILYYLWQSLGSQYLEECAISGIAEEECSLSNKLINDFRGTNKFWLVVISICFVLSQLFRSMRWVLLLKSTGYKISQFNSFATVMVGYLANLAAPRFGEFVRAGVVSKYENVAIEKAMATIVVERIVDVIMLCIMLALGLLFRYDQLWGYISNNSVVSVNTLLYIIGGLVVLGFIGIYVINRIAKLKDESLSPWKLRIKKLITGFVDGLKETRKLPNVTAFWAYSVGIWLMYYLMHYLAFFSFQPVSHLSPMDGLIVFDFGTMGILFPSQGGLGSYHFMIVEALKIFDINPADGLSFAMITFFTLTIFCTILIGAISLILLPIVNSKSQVEKA